MNDKEKGSIRVLIVDDHFVVREGLRLIFETADEIQLIGEATDGAEGVKLAKELQPDVILMDLRMPGMDGLSAIEAIQEQNLPVNVIILTTFDEDELMMRGLQAGAKGFLLKDSDRETLIRSIHAAARGETLLTPGIMERLLAHKSQTRTKAASRGALDLTERETEVLLAAAQGNRNKEIARLLSISERTVKAHLASIYNKFGVDSRAAAIAVAAREGIATG